MPGTGRVPGGFGLITSVEDLLDGVGPALLRNNLLQKLLSVQPTDVDGVVAVALENPFITARLLSVANSAAAGSSQEIKTVRHAVTMLGARRARSMAMASGMRAFATQLGLSDDVREVVLNNSVQRAYLARRFCEVVDPARADEAYTAALMLDLGLPVLLARDEAPYAALLTHGGSTDNLVRDECLHFGIDHGIVGAALLARWNVAPSVRSLVIQHHVSPCQDELFEGGQWSSVRLATFFAGLLPHVFESATAWQSAWMRAMHHLFLGGQYESLDLLLLQVGQEARASLDGPEGAALDPRQLALRLVEELSCDTELMVSNLCQMEQLLTEAQEGSRDLKFQAFTDSLTKLLNRNGFLSLARRRLMAADGQRPVACILCDLDGFKAINDTHGHATGDQALRGFAKMLRAACPREAVIGRLGGDEFAIIMIGHDHAAAVALADRVDQQTRTQALRVSPDLTLTLRASVGAVYVDPCPGLTPEKLLKSADAVMYERKHNGKSGVLFKRVAPSKGGSATQAA